MNKHYPTYNRAQLAGVALRYADEHTVAFGREAAKLCETERAKAIAKLYVLIEEGYMTYADLTEYASEDTLFGVRIVVRDHSGELYEEHIKRIAESHDYDAVAVKLADVSIKLDQARRRMSNGERCHSAVKRFEDAIDVLKSAKLIKA